MAEADVFVGCNGRPRSGKLRIVSQFMKSRNAREALAADAGGSKKTKW
jgi:hypothetical protein